MGEPKDTEVLRGEIRQLKELLKKLKPAPVFEDAVIGRVKKIYMLGYQKGFDAGIEFFKTDEEEFEED